MTSYGDLRAPAADAAKHGRERPAAIPEEACLFGQAMKQLVLEGPIEAHLGADDQVRLYPARDPCKHEHHVKRGAHRFKSIRHPESHCQGGGAARTRKHS